MSTLPARISQPNNTGRGVPATQNAPTVFSISDVFQIAEQVFESKLYPVRSAAAAFTLMMLAQAEGIHPMMALRRYHIMEIGGRTIPTMRADAMQADFQAVGGKVKVVERGAKRAAAVFSHPTLQPDPMEFSYTMEQAVTAGDFAKNPSYKSRPEAMLWARLITSTLTTIAPGIKVGVLSIEEAEDLALADMPVGRHVDSQAEAAQIMREADADVPGQPASGYDSRSYREVAKAACDVTGCTPKDLHRHMVLRAVMQWPDLGPAPSSTAPAVEALTKLYQADRQWVRRELANYCTWFHEQAQAAVVETKPVETSPEEPGSNG